MSITYFTSQETPVYKYKENQLTTAAAAWTPTASTKVGITSMLIANNAAAGTFQVRFGNVGGDVIAAGIVAASGQINITFGGPIISLVYDRAVFFETNTSASSGGWSINLNGFEYGGN